MAKAVRLGSFMSVERQLGGGWGGGDGGGGGGGGGSFSSGGTRLALIKTGYEDRAEGGFSSLFSLNWVIVFFFFSNRNFSKCLGLP